MNFLIDRNYAAHAKVFLLTVACAASLTTYAQYKAEEFQVALIEAKYGALIAYNGQRNSFTLRIVSKSIEPTEAENFLKIDNKLIQFTTIPFQEEFDFKSLSTDMQRNLLNGYKEYEKEYVQEQLKMKIIESEQFLNLEDKMFKYWSFDMPKGNGSVVKQVYLFTICFDQILMLNGPVISGQVEADVKNLLITIAKTIELFPDKVLDLRKLYFDLNN
jgi:hypothetical protein